MKIQVHNLEVCQPREEGTGVIHQLSHQSLLGSCSGSTNSLAPATRPINVPAEGTGCCGRRKALRQRDTVACSWKPLVLLAWKCESLAAPGRPALPASHQLFQANICPISSSMDGRRPSLSNHSNYSDTISGT